MFKWIVFTIALWLMLMTRKKGSNMTYEYETDTDHVEFLADGTIVYWGVFSVAMQAHIEINTDSLMKLWPSKYEEVQAIVMDLAAEINEEGGDYGC